MTDLIKIDFYGDELLATQDETGEVHVALRRMCENLGLDPKSQHEKLKRSAWATMVMITTVAEDGKQRAMSMLPLRAVPMWLAGIDVERVGAHVREKLVRYQLEAAEVLARHFMPKTAPAPVMDLRSMLDSREGIALLLAETTRVVEEERAKRMETEARCLLLSADLRDAAPKVEIFDRIIDAGDTVGVREAHKVLRSSTGVTERELVAFLIERGWAQRLGKRLQPASYGETHGYVTSRMSEWTDLDGTTHTKPEFRITPKGVARLTVLLNPEAA